MMSNSQTNKCLNEKRRRDAENVYIEELAELISERLADISSLSVKPDKCAILQETVKQIRIIKESDGNDDLQAVSSSEVSSSKPNLIASDALGPLLLEALDGFLIVINQKGIIEFVSENVSLYLKFKQNKLISKTIFQLVHKDDHPNFRTLLRNEWSDLKTNKTLNDSSSVNQFASTSNSTNVKLDEQTRSRSRIFNSRFKIKPTSKKKNDDDSLVDDENNDDLTDENELDSLEKESVNYLDLQISARLSVLPETDDQVNKTNSSNKSNLYNIQKNALVCVARRLPLNSCVESSVPVKQFSSELDLNGKCLDVDTTGLNDALKSLIQKMLGKYLNELVIPKQKEAMKKYLANVCNSDASLISEKFNFCIFNNDHHDELIVKMKSKKNNNCIIATYSIIKPIQFNQTDLQQNFKSSSPSNLIQVQQVQLKQSITNTTQNNEPITLSPQASATSLSSTFSSNSTTLVPSTSLVSSFVTSSISINNNRNSGSLSTAASTTMTTNLTFSSNLNNNNNLPKLVNSDENKNNTTDNLNNQENSNSLATSSSMDMFNDDCISISDLFPSSSLLDYENLNNSNENTNNNLDFNVNEFNSPQINQSMQNQFDKNNSPQSQDKLRNLLQQQDSSEQRDSSFTKQMSNLTNDLSKMEANQQSTTSFTNDQSNKNSTLNSKNYTNENINIKDKNSVLNEILNQENDFSMSNRPSSSLSNTFNTSNDLENLFSEKCNTVKTNQQTYSLPNTQQQQNKLTKQGESTSKGNNMLRKLLNDEDSNNLNTSNNKNNINFRKGKDVLINQLLRENSQTGPSSTTASSNIKLLSPGDQTASSNNYFNETQKQQSSKFGPLKRKSNEDHFPNVNNNNNNSNIINQSNNSSGFLNSSNNSCFSNSQPGTPMQIDTLSTIDSTPYPSAKRQSLSESRPSSTPTPVTSVQQNQSIQPQQQQQQMRYPTSNNLNINSQQMSGVNSPIYQQSQQQLQLNFETNTSNTVSYQSNSNSVNNNNKQNSNNSTPQQLAGQNPMLASMLAQTITPPVSSISIPVSIVSQVPQEKLPKGLEKKLIHTPTSVNPQYSNQFDSNMSDQQRFSQNPLHSQQQQVYNQQPQSQQNYYVNQDGNNRTVNLQQQQIKQSQILNSSGQFIQPNSINDQQQTPLSTTHILNNTTHQPVQPTSGSTLSSQYLNNKATTTGLLPNISNTSVNDSNKTNSNFVMNSNQMPMMNRNQQLSSSTCSYYSSEHISSSSNNLNESSSVAISSSTNVTSSSMMMNNMNIPTSSSIDSNDLSSGNSMTNAQYISSTVIGSPASSEDTLLLKILDEFTSSDSPPGNDTSSPNPISSSTTINQQTNAVASSSDSQTNDDLNEKMAIQNIQKQLMSFDTINSSSSINSINNQNISGLNSNQQMLSNDIGLGMNNSYGQPPPAYNNQQSTSGTNTQIMNRMVNSNLNQDQAIQMSTSNTMMTSTIQNQNSMVNRVPLNVQGMQMNSGNFVQQQPNSGIMNNLNINMSNTGQMHGGQMIMNQQQPVNSQRLPNAQKANVENQRKQKMQFAQQVQPKRFVSQNPQIHSQQQLDNNKNRIIPIYSNQVPSNYNQNQPVGSPQASQMATKPSTKQNLSPIQRSKMTKNNQTVVINQNAPSFSTNSYPSPSSQQSSPSPHHLHAQHRNLSSPHAFSPSSPQQKSQLPLQPTSNVLQQTSSQSQNMNQSQIQTNNNNCWSNLPPNSNLLTRTSTSIGLNNTNVTTGIQKRLQEQSDPIRNNPILNAQLSQDSVSYLQIHSQNQPQSNNFNSNQQQQTLPPSSNSPSLNSGLSMRFNRNSPVLTNNSQQTPSSTQQYPSPNFLNSNMNSVPSPPIQQQQLNRNATGNQQRLQPMQARNISTLNNSLHSPVGLSSSQNFYTSDQSMINSSNQMNIQGPPSSQQQNSQSMIYSNCVMNASTGVQQPNNNISSEYVKQGLRAKLGARNQQQMNTQTIQNRAQLPLIQQQQQQQQSQLNIQSSQSHLTHIQQQPNSSTARHLQQTTSTSQANLSNSGNLNQPILNQASYNQSQSQILSNSPQQLNSSLTDEDFDAIGIALSVNNDSSFFDFNNDLPETNSMDGLDSSGINSLIGSNNSNLSTGNSSSMNAQSTNMIRNQSMSNAQPSNSSNSKNGSLLQKLLSEPLSELPDQLTEQISKSS